jgi:hypothetical protein
MKELVITYYSPFLLLNKILYEIDIITLLELPVEVFLFVSTMKKKETSHPYYAHQLYINIQLIVML